LTMAQGIHTFVNMKTTLILDDELYSKASALAGVEEKTALVHLALKALISKMSSVRLALLGGTEKRAKSATRRRSH